VAYPNLKANLDYGIFTYIPDSNTSFLNTAVPAGTYRVNYSVTNTGNVSANPTHLNLSVNGVNTTYWVSVPALNPGQFWNGTSIYPVINQYSANYTVKVFANIDLTDELEMSYADNNRDITLTSFGGVTIELPIVSGTSTDDTYVSVRLAKVSPVSPVTSVSIPITYDPTVCYVKSWTTHPNITYSSSYGRVTLTSNKPLNLASDAEIANITLRAQADNGRNSQLSFMRTANVKTTDSRYLELNVKNGSYKQANITDASVSVFVSPAGQTEANQTITVTVSNIRGTPVAVNASVTTAKIGSAAVERWNQSGISLSPYQSKTFYVKTWKPSDPGSYLVNATINGDHKFANNVASRPITIEGYKLNITENNKRYINYNVTILWNNWFTVGTYYTSNMAGMVNGTVRIWYANWTEVNLSNKNVFEFYYTGQTQQMYGYNSNWNYGYWWVKGKQLGTYNYSITLEARNQSTYVNGTITIIEPMVDIKVVNSSSKGESETNTTLWWEVFNESAADKKQVHIQVAAGSEGRTLQGLNYLDIYPYGCPEQIMSPTLANLRTLQYYENRKDYTLTPEAKEKYIEKIRKGVSIMSAPSGYNAQQFRWMGVGEVQPSHHVLYPVSELCLK
jgi:hypothetical protein